MEEELLASLAKTNVIQLALQAIRLKLEINTEKMREESEANFAFAEKSEAASFGMEQALVWDKQKSNPHLPWIFMETKKKGGPSSTPVTSTSVSVETHSKETKHRYTGPCPSSNQIKWLTLLTRSCAWNKRLESGTIRIGRPFEREFKELFCTKNEQVMVLTKLEGMSWYQGRDFGRAT